VDVKMVNVNHEFVLNLKHDSKDVHGGEMSSTGAVKL
jgi:hypothetical protein